MDGQTFTPDSTNNNQVSTNPTDVNNYSVVTATVTPPESPVNPVLPPAPSIPEPPKPEPPVSSSPSLTNDQPSLNPVPVVRVLSPTGVEYVFYTIALLTGAFGLGSILIILLNGKTSFTDLAYPASLLVVALPVFAWLFLRLKKKELQDDSYRLDASKRRSTQFIQIFFFTISFFSVIGFVAGGFTKMAGKFSGSLVKFFFDFAVVFLISGGILYYFWRDEHKNNR